MLIWANTVYARTISWVGLLVVVAVISACGNRGSLYLKQENENQQQSGHVLTQDADEASKKDKQEQLLNIN